MIAREPCDKLARRVLEEVRQQRARVNCPDCRPTDCQFSPIVPRRSLTSMPQTTRPANSPDDLHPDLVDLGEFVASLPPDLRQRAEPLFERVVGTMKRRRRILTLLQDSLSQLRLDMKYLLFDLDATRRERDELRRRVERRDDADGDSDGSDEGI